MKLLRLDLRAFGPFTDASLSLEDGHHGLHMLYGANEAGKSSALRALAQLFYGIPPNSTDNFIHAHPAMRIGARLRSCDGQTLECIRRKGNKNTLRGGDDIEVIDPAHLAELLHGLDRQAFTGRFGIDYDELVAGGQAIVRGGGELGEILFAAGAGLANLRTIQNRLAEEAESLFKPRGSTQVINRALSQLAEVRKQIRSAQLPSSEWTKHDEALSAARERRQAVDNDLRDKAARRQRLQRIAKALPLIAQRDAVAAELDQLVDAPLLSGDFVERRRDVSNNLKVAELIRRDSEKAIEALDQQIENIEIPRTLLENRAAIEQLHQDAGSCRKAAQDRHTLVDRVEQFEYELRQLLSELGREPDLAGIDEIRLPVAERLKIQDLATSRATMLARQSDAGQQLRRLQNELRHTAEQVGQLPPDYDTTILRLAIRRARQLGDLDAQLVEASAEQQRVEQQTAVQLQQLPLWDGTWQQLEKMDVPVAATIDRFESELDEARSAIAHLEQLSAEVAADLAELAQQDEQDRLQQDVPTEDDQAEARRRRDTGWQLVRAHLEGGEAESPLVHEFIDKFPGANNLIEAFQTSVAAADDVADRLRREADAVARKAHRIADHARLCERRDDLNRRLRQARATHDSTRRAWHDLWQPLLGTEPLSPREMRSWCAAQAELVRAAEQWRAAQAQVDRIEQHMATHRAELSKTLAAGNVTTSSTGDETFGALLDRCEAIATSAERSRARRDELTRDLKKLNDQLPDAQAAVQAAEEQQNQWQTQWQTAMAQICCDPDTSPSQVRAVVETIEELTSKLKEADGLRKRIRDIDADRGRFDDAVQRLRSTLLPAGNEMAATNLAAEQAAAQLFDRLNAGLNDETLRSEWTDQREREAEKLRKAVQETRKLSAVLESMCHEAACQSSEQLPQAEQRSARRRDLEQQLHGLQQQLLELAAGDSLNAFCTESMKVDADGLPLEIEQLQVQIDGLQTELAELLQTIGSQQTELDRMDGSAAAAEAHEQAESLLAQIRGDADQYARLRLAWAVLRGAIERYRERNQGPVLQRASELFAELTLGSFEGLRADYNDKGEPVLVGVRQRTGQTVGVDGMSDGTCDQLYLALRLASLETYLADRDPIPFVVDDILIKFDDDRAVAALKALASVSERTQVIFFTHHEHLVRLAEQNLDDDVLFTHQLDCRQPTRSLEVS